MVEKHYGHLALSYIVDAIRAGAPRFGTVGPSRVATNAMKMPMILDLTNDSFTAMNRHDLVVIEAMMLWPDNENEPDNEATRQRWVHAAIVRHHADHLD